MFENLKKLILESAELPGLPEGSRAYPKSLHALDGALYFIARTRDRRFLVIAGDASAGQFEGIRAAAAGVPAKVCPLTPGNAKALMGLFPFAAPSAHGDASFTLGLGDRLGLASPGHIRAVWGRGIFPVLAQQSMRELKLTGRTYEEVLADAAFAVFREDWRGGWGADGDHLKTAEEIRYALGCGYTMITLDCSEQIDKHVQGLAGSALDAAYAALPQDVRNRYESLYAGHGFLHGNIRIGPEDAKAAALTYGRAIDFASGVYHVLFAQCGRPVDFEVSIDETLYTTTPAAHYIVANELTDRGVRLSSMAPRFVGEFQKGIDYIGDAAQFEKDFVSHAEIAKNFGYRLSIHSGSDKFAVFGIIGRHTGLRVHVKTAGTNWLEALRVIAREDAALFRELLAFALENLSEARAYYHVSANANNVVPMSSIIDADLTNYLNTPDSRQILHITYGLMLQAKTAEGRPRFRERIYAVLHRCEEEYADALVRHIGRHIDMLTGAASPIH
jgi:hypothetical protein